MATTCQQITTYVDIDISFLSSMPFDINPYRRYTIYQLSYSYIQVLEHNDTDDLRVPRGNHNEVAKKISEK